MRTRFVETIANPATKVADLTAIGELRATRNLIYVVDNTEDLTILVLKPISVKGLA